MRRARKFFLLAVMTVTAMTFTPGTANAQEEPVEVTNEVSHCSLSVANCVLHFQGSWHIRLFLLGADQGIVTSCNDEFIALLSENGSGNITSYTTNAIPGGPCTRIKCNDTGENWPITNTGEYTGAQADEGHLTVRICLDNIDNPGGVGTHCNLELQTQNHGNHKYGFRANNVVCTIIPDIAEVRFNGTWESEASPLEVGHTDIEIIH
jgi:hypothetical protein